MRGAAGQNDFYRIPYPPHSSLPKMGECEATQALGNKCMWLRDSRVRILYGPDLLAAGWIAPIIPDTLNNFTSTEHNMQVFEEAVIDLARYMSPRCCGC